MSARLALVHFCRVWRKAPGGLLLIILLFGAISEPLNAAVLLTEIAVLSEQPSSDQNHRRTLSSGDMPVFGERVALKSAQGVIVTISILNSKKTAQGNTVLRGITATQGPALLVIDTAGRVTGRVVMPSGAHQVTTDQYGDMHLWQEVDAAQTTQTRDDMKLPVTTPPEPPLREDLRLHSRDERSHIGPKKRTNVSTSYPRYGSGAVIVRLLIYYDSSMTDYISGLADFLIEITNDAFSDSGVDLSLELAGLISVELDDLVPNGDVLDAMDQATSPFESIESDRDEYLADLTATLRDAEDGWPEDESAGVAYRGRNFELQTVSVTRYTTYEPGLPFVSSYTFAHEVGHNLSASHDRDQYTEAEASDLPGFSYAFGYRVYDSHKTIMSYGYETRTPYFSNPDVTYAGQPLGRSFLAADSADVSRAFSNNRHVAAALKGESFSVDAMKSRWYRYESDCGEDLAEGDPRGEWRYVTLTNQTTRPVEIHSVNYIDTAGTVTEVRYDRGEKYEGGENDSLTWVGYCWMPGDPANTLGTTHEYTYWLYYHPDTGALIETSHFPWSEDFDLDHSLVRVAFSDGGAVSGNTEYFLPVGETKTIEFLPDSDFELSTIQSSCNGSARGNFYDIIATQDDCLVEAVFERERTGNLDSLTTEQEVQLVYVGLLGRPADRPGLAYWMDEITTGKFTIEDLRHNIVNFQEEYLSTLGLLERDDLVVELYLNLFSRRPEEAGLNYWVSGGGATVSIDRLVLALMNGAGATDTQVLLNKAEVASFYTDNYNEYSKSDASSSVRDVDATSESVQQAKDFILGL
jgi:hypothetical protein